MNKERFKGIIIGGVIVGTISLGLSPAIAEGFNKTINAAFNSVNIVLEGEKVDADNIAYNGTTYVPMRKMAEMIGKEVNWNQSTNTATIGDKSSSTNNKSVEYYSELISEFDFYMGEMVEVRKVAIKGVQEERLLTFIKNTREFKNSAFDVVPPNGYENIHRNMLNAFNAYENSLYSMHLALMSVRDLESKDLYTHLERGNRALKLASEFMELATYELELKK